MLAVLAVDVVDDRRYLDVVYTESRDVSNLILARSRWLQLIQRCKEVVKIIHSGLRHDDRPTGRWISLRSTAVSPKLQATDVTRGQQEGRTLTR